MTINENATHFAGKPIVEWPPEQAFKDPNQVAVRIRLSWEEADKGQHWVDKFASFLDVPWSSQIPNIVIGIWDPTYSGENTSKQIVETLVSARDCLPTLKAIFFGDITYEECEISWINQTDVSPLLKAYPNLEHFRVRGAQGLSLGKLQHEQLKSLVVESGGLGSSVVQQVIEAELPNLEHLELWLGTPEYGGDVTIADLKQLLSGHVFPKLKYLGLRDSEIADKIAPAIADAPILERIQILDMSLGTLTDAGASALLASPAVGKLDKLDIHYHYCSNDMVKKLQGLGIEVDASNQRQTETGYDGKEYRYVAVGE